MQQLTLQFDGLAQVLQPVDATAAKKRKSVTKAWYEVYQALVVALPQCGNQVRTWCRAHREQLETYVGGSAITVFCVILYILAAVLQGGAQ
jgi:hypothetical protein